MPARFELTPEKLDEVVKQRQSGKSWLAVEKATGVSRRVGRRAYGEWEKKRSVRELEAVRFTVGQIEFQRHLDALSSWAEGLLDYLRVPDLPSDIKASAKVYLSLMMEKGPPGGAAAGTLPVDPGSRARNERHNRLLFESLKAHTADTVRWDSLGDWMAAWDKCFKVLPGLAAMTKTTVASPGNESPGFEDWFPAAGSQASTGEIIVAGIVEALWKGVLAGSVSAAKETVYIEPAALYGDDAVHINIGYRELYKRESRKAGLLTGYCLDTLDRLWATSEASELQGAVKTMGRVLGELEGSLDPLVLRPQILRTRCPLCPA